MFENNGRCPRCNAARLKTWDELNDEEKFLAKKLPSSAEFSPKERKTHLFCPRCWFEEMSRNRRI